MVERNNPKNEVSSLFWPRRYRGRALFVIGWLHKGHSVTSMPLFAGYKTRCFPNRCIISRSIFLLSIYSLTLYIHSIITASSDVIIIDEVDLLSLSSSSSSFSGLSCLTRSLSGSPPLLPPPPTYSPEYNLTPWSWPDPPPPIGLATSCAVRSPPSPVYPTPTQLSPFFSNNCWI
jgi:hypothetical protein